MSAEMRIANLNRGRIVLVRAVGVVAIIAVVVHYVDKLVLAFEKFGSVRTVEWRVLLLLLWWCLARYMTL